MKKSLLSIGLMLSVLVASAQCPTIPYSNVINLASGSTSNTTYSATSNAIALNADTAGSTLSSTAVIGSFAKLTFNGAITVHSKVNMATSSNIYVRGNSTVVIDSVGVGNHDSIVIGGGSTLTIPALAVANSDNRVILGTGASITANGITYTTAGNVSIGGKVLHIVVCADNSVAMPITLEYFRGNMYGVEFKLAGYDQVAFMQMQYSAEGSAWDNDRIYSPSLIPETYTTNKLGFYRLKVVDNDGSVSYSNVVRSGIVKGTEEEIELFTGIALKDYHLEKGAMYFVKKKGTTQVYKVVVQ